MLPSTLLEFAALRGNALTSQRCQLSRLHAHAGKAFSTMGPVRQAAAATAAYNPTAPPPENHGLPVRSKRSAFKRGGSLTPRTGRPITDVGAELEKRIKALESAAEVETTTFDPLAYSEEDLLTLYEDLLALPPDVSTAKAAPTEPVIKENTIKTDEQMLLSLERRLLESLPTTSDVAGAEANLSTHSRVLSHISKFFFRQGPNAGSALEEQHTIKPCHISVQEFESIGRVAVAAEDYQSAELNLRLIKLSGLAVTEDALNPVMRHFASNGNVKGVEGLLTNYLSDVPTERQRHYHITAHLQATPPATIPTSTLDLVHVYESQNLAPPMQTYTSVITSLFSSNLSIGRAQAWDLFCHMRYVAHPDPDAALYTLMIRGCASPVNVLSSEPEKALDLWTEMTVDHKIPPTAGAYDAVILACARSGKKMYVGEAFRLARQMLDSHRDAQGASAFTPSRRTFCALLEGAKRIGDLGKARWILAEMASERRLPDGRLDPEGINEEVMMHMFHSYASYNPPVRRSVFRTTKASPVTPGASATEAQAEATTETKEVKDQNIVKASPSQGTFTPMPPQTSEEVLREVETLFNRIMRDTGRADPSESAEHDGLPERQLFQQVTITPRLLNSYLSVFYKHGKLAEARDLYHSLFETCNVQRSARTHTEALERCANSRRGEERKIALEFAEEVWPQWRELEETMQDNGRTLSPRIIEKAHVAMIRVLALTENIERAMQHVRDFASKYPSSAVRVPSPKSHLRGTRTALDAARPLVRFTSNAEVPDDYVPPLLMFNDLQVLHNRLLAAGMVKEIGYLTYLSKSYEWALRVRRDATVKQRPSQPTENVTHSD